METNRKPRAITKLELIIVIAAALLLGVITLNNQLNTVLQHDQVTSNAPTRRVSNSQVYIKLPTLSIAFYIPASFKDLTYVTKNLPAKSNESDGVAAYFSTANLTKLANSCSASAAALGALVKTGGQYPVNQTNAVQNYGILVKQFTNFYIVAAYQQKDCAPNNSYASAVARTETSTFLNAVHASIQQLNN
jgi:hypothetical protein